VKLLFIEDNSTLVGSLKDYLGKDCKIDATSQGFEGIEKAQTRAYDAIVLDLGLPDMPGRDVCLAIRKAQVTTPILVLSGSSEPAMKVALLRAGADDYLTKPFHGVELKARLLALMRRGHFDPEAPYLLKVENLTLDPTRRLVERAGQKIVLRRKEFDILEYLLRNRGKILTRTMIMETVWGADSESWEATVDVHVKHLRDKIDKDFDYKLIKTVYGVGYTIDDLAEVK
jgi:DNA-binding response OmpR family regulator